MSPMKVIFRLDDISPLMNFEKFKIITQIFVDKNLPAVLGVIPRAEGEKKSLSRRSISEFIRVLTFLEKKGFEIAQHGYTHEIITNDGGELKLNEKSEFAGLDYKNQFERIKKGKTILQSWGFNPVTFISPWHSFDKNTIRAVRSNSFKIISDGVGLFPYKKDKLLFIPQILWQPPKYFIPGVLTVCLHPDVLPDDEIHQISSFITRSRYHITTCRDVFNSYIGLKKHTRIVFNFTNDIFLSIYKIKRLLG